MAKHKGFLNVFRHRTYRVLWASSVVSNTGGMIQQVGAAWAMTLLSASPGMVALVQSMVTLPLMVASLAAGVLADSHDRRKVMLVSQVFMLVVSVALTVLAWKGILTPGLLLTFTFLIGLGTALHNPSWQASFGSMVPREDLPAAVAMNAMGMNITRSVGPAIGGLIVAVFGAAVAFAINALTYVSLIAALLLWTPKVEASRLPRETFLAGMTAGLRYFMLSPNIISVDVRGFLFGFAAIAMQALMPLVARDQLGGDATTYGILLGSFGLGAVVGALNAARIRSRLRNEAIARSGFLIFAACSIVVSLSPWTMVTIPAIFIAGSAWINTMSLLNVIVQMSAPRWVLGRLISIFMTWIFGGMALGGWIWGLVTESHGLLTAFGAAAVILVLGALWGLQHPLPEYGAANLDPVNRFTQPDIRLDLHRRSGPIKIWSEYRIDDADTADFLAAMGERRRIRIRDGAKRWSLLRDLSDPELWIESYHFSTWTEYIRHNDRRTVTDDAVILRLHSLHRGPEPIRVRRLIERQTVEAGDDTPRMALRPEDMHH